MPRYRIIHRMRPTPDCGRMAICSSNADSINMSPMVGLEVRGLEDKARAIELQACNSNP